jgi:Integrase core domain
LFPSSPSVGEYPIHTHVCKHRTGSAWGCSAAAPARTTAQSVHPKSIGTQFVFMVLSKSPRPTLANISATRHARKRSNVVSPHVESCGSSSINGHNVNDIYNPQLHKVVEAVVAPCAHCQRYKNVQRGHGATAPREADILPWSHVAVDTIGPWVLKVYNREEHFYVLTIIDMVTNLTEIVRLDNRTSAHAATVFTNTWLARYPKPTTCIYDQGSEFLGWPFQHMLTQYDIQRRPTTVKNPQANAIYKRMHQAVGNSLRVLKQWTPPNHLDDAHLIVDTALANAMYATHATFHSGLMTTPGALSFSRDMVMNIPFVADLTLMRQRLIDERVIRSNARCHSYDYQPGQEVLKLVYKPDKLEPRAQGPYDIIAVHTNGTMTIQLNAHTTERISNRNVKPFHQN